jgi:oligopeptide transport system substrate-binding protein
VECDESLFLGLTDFDDTPDSPVIPEIATKWSVSDDGLTWTFEMRNDIWWVHYDPATKKFEKKRLVTAQDVEYGAKRTINPETASDYAYVSYIIKNAEAVNTGESTDLDSIGVKAVDDYTVEFTLEQPAGFFPAIASMWVVRPVPREAIEEHGDLWTEPGNIWSNGPFALDTWEHENRMVLVKNPHFYNAKNVSIEQINYVMVTESSTAMAMYENGELDITLPPLEDMDRIRADPV